MRKKILIGSLLVLTLLFLMPSIPAVQQKSVEEGIKQNLQEKLDANDMNILKELDLGKLPDHPFLNFLILIPVFLRYPRIFLLLELSMEVDEWGYLEIIHPLLFIRMTWLLFTTNAWIVLWWSFYNSMGWDFYLPRP